MTTETNNNKNRSQTLYRKWRSQTFNELVGQEAITRTLQNAIAANRVAHAYLFCGPRGTGKTSTGRLLAKAVNCLAPVVKDRPCDECEACRSIAEARAMDLIEIDAASNRGIDEIRELRDKINFQPSFLKKKVYIIDEVHMMTEAAFNALLKTLEEPPPHALFILATTDPQDIPATVVSRCQRFDFQRIGLDEIADRLAFVCSQENVPVEPAALDIIARQATGSLRDALSLLDQLIVFSGNNITAEAVRLMLGLRNNEAVADFIDALTEADMSKGLEQINRLVQTGSDLKRFNRELVEHLRSLMLLKVNPNGRELADMTEEARKRLQEQIGRLELGVIITFLKIFSTVDYNLKVSPYGQLPLEIALMECLLQPSSFGMPQPTPITRNAPSLVAAPPSRPNPPPPTPIRSEQKPTDIGERINKPIAVEQIPETPLKEGGVLEISTLTQLWPRILKSIDSQSKMIAALLQAAKPTTVNGNQISLVFDYEFHCKRISQDLSYRTMVEEHISKQVGQRVAIKCLTKGDVEAAAPPPPPENSAPSKEDERNHRITDLFNARLLD